MFISVSLTDLWSYKFEIMNDARAAPLKQTPEVISVVKNLLVHVF